jgi:hypothetical protein
MEMDIIETNGNCAMATTWHTDPDHRGGCDEGGCAGHSQLPGGVFKMRAEFSTDGTMKTILNGKEVKVRGPLLALDKAKGIVEKTMKTTGAIFHSGQVEFNLMYPPQLVLIGCDCCISTVAGLGPARLGVSGKGRY